MSEFFESNLGAGLIDAGNNVLSQGIAYFRDRAARQWQEEIWNKQNEYNLPINQRKRLEQAGINPNLAFGSSASAMGSSMPSSPTQHVPQMNLGDFYLKYKQAKAQIKAQEAATRREDQLTRQLEMNNQMFELLFNDRLQTTQGDLYVKRIENAWKEDHLKALLDAGLTEKEVRNDLSRAQKLYYDALATKTEKATDLLIQEYNHLVKKYGFEDYYYDMRLNPYETSTIMGFLRGFFGPFTQLMESLIGMF